MRILLIYPPVSGKERYGSFAKVGSYLPPLGLGYIAAVLENEHTVRIIDGSVLDITVKGIGREIERYRPDVVGISVQSFAYSSSIACCDIAKEVDSRITTVLGGPHPSACPTECIQNKNVDIVVFGEGEVTIVELISEIKGEKRFEKVNGIFYKKNGKAFSTPPRERIKDLDSLPFPALHLLPIQLYKPASNHYKKLPAFTIMCGRGCPYRCTFCSHAKVFGRKIVMRNQENIIKEIEFLMEKYGAKEIMFFDDTFGIGKDWIYRLCDFMEKKNIRITWSCWARADGVDKDLLGRMASVGCHNITYGVESGNQRILDTVKKDIRIEQIKDAFNWSREAGIETRATFILGLPNETCETMVQTIKFAIEINADYAQFHFFTPYPGTELSETKEQYGKLDVENYSEYTAWFPVFIPNNLTKQDLEKARMFAYKRFYLRPKYWVSRLLRIRSFYDIQRYFDGAKSVIAFLLKRG